MAAAAAADADAAAAVAAPEVTGAAGAVAAGTVAAGAVVIQAVQGLPSRLSQKERAGTNSCCRCMITSAKRTGALPPAGVPAPNLTRKTTQAPRRLCENEQPGDALQLRSPSF